MKQGQARADQGRPLRARARLRRPLPWPLRSGPGPALGLRSTGPARGQSTTDGESLPSLSSPVLMLQVAAVAVVAVVPMQQSLWQTGGGGSLSISEC